MPHEIVIDCPHCVVRVKAAATTYIGSEDISFFLVECPSCRNPLFGSSEPYRDERNDWAWAPAERLWPNPAVAELSAAIPQGARRELTDAQKCVSHGIYSAAAVLCGRALERLIKEKAGNSHMIARGLAELKARGIIDQRLFDWAEALRRERNVGAHATDEDTTRENAEDILDFTIAIFDYVYTLTEKYERYVARRRPATTAPPPQDAG